MPSAEIITVAHNSLQWWLGTIPDKTSHIITMSTRAIPNSMTTPSRVVNVDRFLPPLRIMENSKGGQYNSDRTALVRGGFLEVEPELSCYGARCDVMRAAEG